MKFWSYLIVAVVGLLQSPAHADLLLEPYLGFHTGNWTYSTSSSTSKYDMKGPTYGARVGYQGMGLMAGIDYMTGSWEDDANPKDDVTPSELGLFIGYNFPVMVRVYGVFAPDPLNPTLKFKDVNSSSKYEGSTMKIGVGFNVVPLLSVNLEYMMGTYDEVDGQAMNNDLETKMYGVTVSFPLTL